MKTLDEYYEVWGKEIYTYIYSFCHNHAIAEDVLQDTFYKAYKNINEAKANHLKAWLFKIAYNTFVDHIRKEKRIQLREDFSFDKSLKEPNFEHKLVEQETINEVFMQINQLPFNQKQALLLHIIHKLSYSEISEILEITESSVKSLIFRARVTLRKKTEGYHHE